jgi:predicted metal-dependent HD superfamily phosphohydrolase
VILRLNISGPASEVPEDLRQLWVDLLEPYVDRASYARASFESLARRYLEEGRSCHGIDYLEHLVFSICDLTREPTSAPDDPLATTLAGFFRYTVLAPGVTDSRRHSARLAGNWLDGLGIAPEVVDEVRRLVLLPDTYEAAPDDLDSAVTIDADLVVYGSDYESYRRWLEGLRREHDRLGRPDFEARRIRFVKSLTRREHIYHTASCRERFEAMARRNLEAELRLLGAAGTEGAPALAEPPPAEDRSGGRVHRGLGVGVPADRGVEQEGRRDRVDAEELSDGQHHLLAPPSGRPGVTAASSGRQRHRSPSDPRHLVGIVAAALVALFAIYAAVQLLRPVPSPKVSLVLGSQLRVPGNANLPWPTLGEAQVDVEGVGAFAPVGPPGPVPVASLTKMMTALVVMKDRPLTGESAGPSITVSSADEAVYRADVASQQSVVRVVAGERISERQALEALLVGSGNNIAQLLADWDAGDASAFVQKMNASAKSLGLSHTRYVDPSGAQDGNVSTLQTKSAWPRRRSRTRCSHRSRRNPTRSCRLPALSTISTRTWGSTGSTE